MIGNLRIEEYLDKEKVVVFKVECSDQLRELKLKFHIQQLIVKLIVRKEVGNDLVDGARIIIAHPVQAQRSTFR